MARPISILDLAQRQHDHSSAETIRQCVRIAQRAEAKGYHRVWYAEHHNTAGLASGSPELMIAHVAQQTASIRVGSGGVMLPNQAPLKVVEDFKLLEAMYPGRVDLGLGRAPGTDQKTAYALRRNPDALAAEDYPQNVAELLAYDEGTFPEGHLFASITPTPSDPPLPPVWLLGSSAFSGQLAAHLGLGFAFASHINRPIAIDMMRHYRDAFEPSARRAEPSAILAVSIILGRDDAHLEELLIIARARLAGLVTGNLQPIMSLADARAVQLDPAVRLRVDSMMTNYLIGTPAQVGAELKHFADDAQADEVMFMTTAPDADQLDWVIDTVYDTWQGVDTA